jgi:uncharacterized protein YndB with AHSA1/START domain
MTETHPSPALEGPAAPGPGIAHDTFTIARSFDLDRAEVFAGFADDRRRRRWVRMPGSGATYDHDFRVGGGEDARSTFSLPGMPAETVRNRSRYLGIVPDRRIVFVYEAIVDGVTRWVSLVTVTLEDAPEGGTTLTWTEQATFLVRTGDGSADLPHLRTGTALRLNGLPAALGVEPSTAS